MTKVLRLDWPRNTLRQSLICSRITELKSADQVALEAGNSPAVIFKHYRELTTGEQAEAWFSILPKEGQWNAAYHYDRKKRIVTLGETARAE